MLVTKRFYCLFPLVFHSMMFSMVQAPPMKNLGSYGDNQRDPYDWINNAMEEDDSGNPFAEDLLQSKMYEFSNIVHPNNVASSSHPITSLDHAINDLERLVAEIHRLKPHNSDSYQFGFHGKNFKAYDFRVTGDQFLERFFQKASSPLMVNQNTVTTMIPLFFIYRDIYILASKDDNYFQVFRKGNNQQFLQLYGEIKSDFTLEKIREFLGYNALQGRDEKKHALTH